MRDRDRLGLGERASAAWSSDFVGQKQGRELRGRTRCCVSDVQSAGCRASCRLQPVREWNRYATVRRGIERGRAGTACELSTSRDGRMRNPIVQPVADGLARRC